MLAPGIKAFDGSSTVPVSAPLPVCAKRFADKKARSKHTPPAFFERRFMLDLLLVLSKHHAPQDPLSSEVLSLVRIQFVFFAGKAREVYQGEGTQEAQKAHIFCASYAFCVPFLFAFQGSISRCTAA